MHKCHVNHQGTHQTLYILNQNHPGYLLAKTRPDQTIFSALTNLTIDFDFELSKIYKCWIRSVYFVLSYLLFLISWWQVERFASWSWSENPDDCKLWLHAPSPETRLVRCTLSGPRIQRKLQIFQMRPTSDPCIANMEELSKYQARNI